MRCHKSRCTEAVPAVLLSFAQFERKPAAQIQQKSCMGTHYTFQAIFSTHSPTVSRHFTNELRQGFQMLRAISHHENKRIFIFKHLTTTSHVFIHTHIGWSAKWISSLKLWNVSSQYPSIETNLLTGWPMISKRTWSRINNRKPSWQCPLPKETSFQLPYNNLKRQIQRNLAGGLDFLIVTRQTFNSATIVTTQIHSWRHDTKLPGEST